MDCGKCLHFEVCCLPSQSASLTAPPEGEPRGTDCRVAMLLAMTGEGRESCGSFKDRGRYKEVPCKIGDKAWVLKKTRDKSDYIIKGGKIATLYYNCEMELTAGVYAIGAGRIGKTVFLSREEAEKAMEERRKGPDDIS